MSFSEKLVWIKSSKSSSSAAGLLVAYLLSASLKPLMTSNYNDDDDWVRIVVDEWGCRRCVKIYGNRPRVIGRDGD